MHAYELLERATADLDAAAQAARWAHIFSDWMNTHNSSTPLREIDGVRATRLTTGGGETPAYCLPHIPGTPADLTFAIGWGRGEHTRGEMCSSLLAGQLVYHVVLYCPDDPGDDTDVIWGVTFSSLVHELTHYHDYKRGYDAAALKRWRRGHTPRSSSPSSYYNQPLELNAHFQQALGDMFTSMAATIAQSAHYGREEDYRPLASFQAFLTKFLDTADHQKIHFLKSLSGKNKKKLISRLYKIFDLIKRDWPNIPQIRQYADRLVAAWKAADEADGI